MKRFFVSLSLMSISSIILLFTLSVLVYIFKWKADTALVGITIIYIVVGFLGGYSRKKHFYETSIVKKLLEGVFVGTLFMAFLLLVSFFILENGIILGSRFFMIWMLVVGSAALGIIL